MPKTPADDDKKPVAENPQALALANEMKNNTLAIIQRFIQVKVYFSDQPAGKELLVIDLPFIKGYINIEIVAFGNVVFKGHITIK